MILKTFHKLYGKNDGFFGSNYEKTVDKRKIIFYNMEDK